MSVALDQGEIMSVQCLRHDSFADQKQGESHGFDISRLLDWLKTVGALNWRTLSLKTEHAVFLPSNQQFGSSLFDTIDHHYHLLRLHAGL